MRRPHLIILLFFCCSPAASAQPLLITQPDSTRAISMDSVNHIGEPYALNSYYGRTRFSLFALNVQATDPSSVTAEAEDASHRIYQLKVEYVGRVPVFTWLTQVSLLLPDGMTDVGDLLLSISYQGVRSNRVRVGVGHIGGGLPDDSLPASVPPYTIKGRVLSNGVGLSNAYVALSGAQTGLQLTDEQGRYSFTVASTGNVTVTASLLYSSFNPPSQSFSPIYGNRVADFQADLITKSITGRVTDENNNPIGGVALTLGGFQQASTVSDSNGLFSFTSLWAGGRYILTAAKKGYLFSPDVLRFDTLGANATADFVAAPSYDISGRVTEDNGRAIAGAQVALTNGLTAATDVNGFYLMRVRKGSYSIGVAASDIFNFSPAALSIKVGEDQTVNFTGVRKSYSVSGQVLDDRGAGIDNVTVIAGDRTAVTSGGKYSFSNLAAGLAYTVTASSTSVFSFTPQTIVLMRDANINLQGVRRTYQISGRMTDGTNPVTDGVLKLDGSTTAATAVDGGFSFPVTAGLDHTITAKSGLYDFAPQTFKNVTANIATLFVPSGPRHYTITGRVMDGDKPITNVSMKLDESHGQFYLQAYADANGYYTIENVEKGLSYALAPVGNEIYHFNPTYIEFIDSDRTINFSGIRNSYTIKGRVLDKTGAPLADVGVRLVGYVTLNTTTDAQGNYALGNVPAGSAYQIALSKEDYVFSPPGQSIPILYRDESADFTATRTYTLSGRVTDEKGAGLFGVEMNLEGAENAKLTTGVNGDYEFVVTTPGNYTLTPVYPQGYYTFAPVNQSLNLTGRAGSNFTAKFSMSSSPSYVLEFDGTPATVDYGYYWPEGVDLGHFYWEFWAMPGADDGSRYLLSDGYGGAHALLFGFSGTSQPGRYTLFGNTWSSSNTSTSFFSDEGPAANEWGHFAVGWDGQFIVVYYDGVPVGRTPFAGARRTLGPDAGGSWLLIGGSDHQNFKGRLAQVRGFENRNPREASPFAAFAPETLFGRDGNLLSYFFRPGNKVADLSSGYYSFHQGGLRGMIYGYAHPCPDCPVPKYVMDSTAPDFLNAAAPGQIQSPVDTPQPAPSDALIFDSFSRRNSTYILGGAGGLGSAEAGNQGWQTGESGLQPFGIINGHAVVLADARSVAWVNAQRSDLLICVDRLAGAAGAGVDTGLAFRVVDSENYFFAYTTDSDKLYLGYYQQGARHDLAARVNIPSGWRTLKVLTRSDGTMEVYASDGLIYSAQNQTMAAATGAGLYNNSPGLGLANRWDNFTVKAK